MTIKIKNNDLLKEEVEAIVNTVNCVGVMGKGIALQFKQKWPQNFKAYEAACSRGEVRPGKMFIYDAGGLVKPNFIINFPTKQHWREKSKMSYITAGLEDLVKEINHLNIKSIALPPLGCGNGGLEWSLVREEIIKAFEPLRDIDVHLFEPKGAPAPKTMENRTKPPRMTPSRAAIVMVISFYQEMQYALSRIEMQKLAYFLEESGQLLNLEFCKNQYGPYSNKLRHVLKAMDGHYIYGVGDHDGRSEISVVPEAFNEAEKFLSTTDNGETVSRIKRVGKLIEGFETPYGMELLATVHWVANNESHATNVNEAVAAVHSWNARKRKILPEEHITLAWEKLEGAGWLQQKR